MINSKIYLELPPNKNYVFSSVAGDTTSKIADTKLYVPIVTLLTRGNVKLTKQLSKEINKDLFIGISVRQK